MRRPVRTTQGMINILQVITPGQTYHQEAEKTNETADTKEMSANLKFWSTEKLTNTKKKKNKYTFCMLRTYFKNHQKNRDSWISE